MTKNFLFFCIICLKRERINEVGGMPERKRICLTKVCETAILRNRYKGVSRDGYVFFHFKRETEDGI